MGEIVSGQRRIGSDELLSRAWRAASGLASVGVGAGDTVALYLRNDLPFFEASFAAGRLGAYATPVNWHYTEDEARYLFENSGAKAIVIHADLLGPVRNAIPSGVPVFVVETPAEIATAYGIAPELRRIPPGMTAWPSWLERFEPHDAVAEARWPPARSSTPPAPPGVRRACAAIRRRRSRQPAAGASCNGPLASRTPRRTTSSPW